MGNFEIQTEIYNPFTTLQDCNINGVSCESFSLINSEFSIEPIDGLITESSQIAFPGVDQVYEIKKQRR